MPLFASGQAEPGRPFHMQAWPDSARFPRKYGIEDPEQEHHANTKLDDQLNSCPLFAQSVPQRFLMCLIPATACSIVNEGLNSNTFKCSGLTNGLIDAKSIMPLPGDR